MTDPKTALRRRTDALAHLQAHETWSARLLGGWLPGIVDWDVKHTVAQQLWENLQHARDLRTRLWELRIGDPDRQVGFAPERAARAMGAAPSDVAFLAGLHLVWTPATIEAYQQLLHDAHPIQDGPSLPVLRRIVEAKRRQHAWAHTTVEAMIVSGTARREVDRWMRYVRDVLDACGGVAGSYDGSDMPDPLPGVDTPLPFLEAKRDDRFELALESGIRAEPDDRLGQVLFQFANYGAEMQAAETLGSVLWETGEMPWEYYFDVGRHCHDEARHSKMGEARLAEMGHDIRDFPHSAANYTWRQLMDPMRRYCTLTYVIEADSFAYKQATYQQHLQHGDHASAQAVLFDIADETMHVRWGAKWVPELMKRYGYDGTVEQLVAECRERTAQNSASPLQREAAGSP